MIRRERSRRRTGVFRLNQGSSPFGRHQTFALNRPGGTFGSGRTAGGGSGAGDTLAHALLAPAMSVEGAHQADAGPPPVEQGSSPPAAFTSSVDPNQPRYPTFNPQPVAPSPLSPLRPPTSYLPPTFDPSIALALRRQPIRFF